MSVANSQSGFYASIEANDANTGVASNTVTSLTWHDTGFPIDSGIGFQGGSPGNNALGAPAVPSACVGLIAPVNGLYLVQGTLVFPGLVANTDNVAIYLTMRLVSNGAAVTSELIGSLRATTNSVAQPITFNGSTIWGLTGGVHYVSMDIVWVAATAPSTLSSSTNTVLKMALVRSL